MPFVRVNQAIFYSTRYRGTDQFQAMEFREMYDDCSGPLGEQFSDSVLTDAFYIWWLSYILEVLTPVELVKLVQKVILVVLPRGHRRVLASL